MSDSFKICPVCDTPNHVNAPVCSACGTDLQQVDVPNQPEMIDLNKIEYDFHYGEADLQEQSVRHVGNMYLVIAATILLTLVLAIAGIWLAADGFLASPTEIPAEVIGSPTPRPTMNAATVTQGPPTATATSTPAPTLTPSMTPTRGPCVITLPQGQTMIWALGQCGHRSLDVMPTVLALNDLADASSVRSGQEIQIPRPTATTDPFALPTETATIEGEASLGEIASLNTGPNEAIEAFQPTVTPTLPPGVMWHEIQAGQNIITVAVLYNTDVQTLSQLNRQVDFARCDFGETFGGSDCIVQLFQGQLLRVPAPTPTPTLSPTPDPNATATPTATATVNVPSAFSPTDRQFFYRDELVTLRWVPTATLNDGESYRVDVLDRTSGRQYTAYTSDIFFTIPAEWQGTGERHDYEWTVGIVDDARPEDIRYQTDPLIFVWQGLSPVESD